MAYLTLFLNVLQEFYRIVINIFFNLGKNGIWGQLIRFNCLILCYNYLHNLHLWRRLKSETV